MLDILSVCSFPWIWLFHWCGGLNQIDRNQSQPKDVKAIETCVTRTQDSEPVETSLRKVPDLQKDDLAQRRIQGRCTPRREAPSFIKLSDITEADLETWERLKVSGKTRCVMIFPQPWYDLTFKMPNAYPSFIFYFDIWKKVPLKTQSF